REPAAEPENAAVSNEVSSKKGRGETRPARGDLSSEDGLWRAGRALVSQGNEGFCPRRPPLGQLCATRHHSSRRRRTHRRSAHRRQGRSRVPDLDAADARALVQTICRSELGSYERCDTRGRARFKALAADKNYEQASAAGL